MDNINHLLVVFTAYVFAAGSPGPSTLRIMGVAMNHGRQAGLALAVFPATPLSCSVEFGRVWQPKAQPSFDVYDRVPEQGFVRRFRIEP
ncbi:MAG: hypothetical protein MRY75_18550 [Marivita sp.]|mgnify:CR=1 FL=1|uniref:hypothetical protein n=1 Tax=Marivita sp. TaxID=2003365 RepID=UPI0025BFAF12|nr:hypothetical protein [Marivita sp.]MCI5112548.1 hypothetical protein [Marivita sp.]